MKEWTKVLRTIHGAVCVWEREIPLTITTNGTGKNREQDILCECTYDQQKWDSDYYFHISREHNLLPHNELNSKACSQMVKRRNKSSSCKPRAGISWTMIRSNSIIGWFIIRWLLLSWQQPLHLHKRLCNLPRNYPIMRKKTKHNVNVLDLYIQNVTERAGIIWTCHYHQQIDRIIYLSDSLNSHAPWPVKVRQKLNRWCKLINVNNWPLPSQFQCIVEALYKRQPLRWTLQ